MADKVKKVMAYPEYNDISIKSQDWCNKERSKQSRVPQHPTTLSFPVKLYNMIEQSSIAGMDNTIAFQSHGRAFRIIDREQFHTRIMSKHFPDNAHFESFLRQLNIYGFLRMKKKGPDHGCYYHELFLQGRPDLCSLLKRTIKSQHTKRRMYDPTTEPNFYDMVPIHHHNVSNTSTDHQEDHNNYHRCTTSGSGTNDIGLNTLDGSGNRSRKEPINYKDYDSATNIPTGRTNNFEDSLVRFQNSHNPNHVYNSSSTVPVIFPPSGITPIMHSSSNGGVTTTSSNSMVSGNSLTTSHILSILSASQGSYGVSHTMGNPTHSYIGMNDTNSVDISDGAATSILIGNATPQQQQQQQQQQTASSYRTKMNLSKSILDTDAYHHSVLVNSVPICSANATTQSTALQQCYKDNSSVSFFSPTNLLCLPATAAASAEDVESCSYSCGSDITPIPPSQKKTTSPPTLTRP